MQVYEDDFRNIVKIYYNDLKRYKPINRLKEKQLMTLAKAGDLSAKNKIIESNLRFVFDMARKYAQKGVPIAELISEGNMALFKAIDKFDNEKDVKFITYAVWWIRQAMTEAVRKNKVKNDAEVAEEISETLKKAISSSIYDDEDDNDIYYECDEASEYPDNMRSEIENNQEFTVSSLVGMLGDKERDIIESYYGLNGKKEETLFEIGKRYNLTCERVRQVKSNVMKKLRSEALVHYDTEDLFV